MYANSVDPDQMQQTAVSDLDLHSLPMSLLWDARHKVVERRATLWLLCEVICDIPLLRIASFGVDNLQ